MVAENKVKLILATGQDSLPLQSAIWDVELLENVENPIKIISVRYSTSEFVAGTFYKGISINIDFKKYG